MLSPPPRIVSAPRKMLHFSHMQESLSPLAWRKAATLGVPALSKALAVEPEQGLSPAVAAARLVSHGQNAIPTAHRSAGAIMRRQFESPFIWLLIAASGIAFATGEPVDASMIALFTLINTTLGFTQEYRAERAVQSLLTLWEDKCHVRRGGTVQRIPTKDIVPGDIVRLQAGDRIPADVRFLSARDLTVNESVLTGESLDVTKVAEPQQKEPAEYSDAGNMGFFGTSVLTGEADAMVIATGVHASLGEIATLTQSAKTESSFEKEIASFSGFILKTVIVTLAFMFAINVGIKGLGRVQELLLFSIALTVGVIPEALPVVATMALSRGAQRMAARKVVVKRLSAINDLGSIDVLCTDKTGTITENRMNVADVRATDADACLRYATLASSFIGETGKQQNNAFDLALWQHASPALRAEAKAVKKIAEVPFDPVHRVNAVLVQDGERVAILRGSTEEVLKRCARPDDELAIGRWVAERGLTGNRVIAVACKASEGEKTLHDANGYRFMGLVSFHDPIKRDSMAAVKKARELGVRIKILTGDSRETAGAVAAQLHLIADPTKTITGAEFDALDALGQHAALDEYAVFARMNPVQKFTVLQLLKEKNVVGFLGEGFNDAPGLKIAHVGLAVDSASDISREAADVILLGKGLGVIFDGIEEGRRTFANTIKYLRITLASNFGNFYSVAIASFFIPFLPMLPLQILLLNLLTDLPMITIAADTAGSDELQSPSKYDARQIIFMATILGIVSSAFDFATFAIFVRFGAGELQSTWFTVSALTEIALFYSLRTVHPFWRATRPPWSIMLLTGLAAFASIALPFTAFGQQVFHFVRPLPRYALIGTALVAGYFVATETVKLWLTRGPATRAAALVVVPGNGRKG
ncbi:MAG: hypothetical protein RLZZ324_1099 [Candidatus Parcubacteria bacterium]|jgi:Mg2+-importing ATPase